jgi:hypothetical protein
VVRHADAAELRIVVAVILAAAANAVLVSLHFSKLGAHLVIALANPQMRYLARRNGLEARKHAGEKKQGGEQRRCRST